MQQPDLRALEGSIARALTDVARRIRAREILRAVARGAAAAALATGATAWRAYQPGVALGATIGIAVVAWRLWRRRTFWSHRGAAAFVERAAPRAANVVVTAQELLEHPERARPWVRARVFGDAMRVMEPLPAREGLPLRRDAMLAIGALALFVAAVAGIPQRAAIPVRNVAARGIEAGRRALSAGPTLTVLVTPPPYTRLPPVTVTNPERLDAVQGSRARVIMDGGGPWTMRFGPAVLPARQEEGRWAAELVLSESGYFAIEQQGAPGAASRLLPVTVTADRSPSIRIDAPAKDLLVPKAEGAVPLRAVASDDFGLRSVELRYTKVSGSGEQFEFTEGSLPLEISRTDLRSWQAEGTFALARLGIQPGDSLVYRAVARDERPGDAGQASSDTFFIEVAGPGQVALEGFELPPDRERYALSQQMILLKLQRLRARERSMIRSALEEEVAALAAEQRAIRANFVFLMGGEVEDEEQEAEHSHEIQEGRLENHARREIMEAIQHMSRVEAALAAIDTGSAVPPARAAVEALQRAFGRNRYFLRTLPVRSRVDPSRRLTGTLDEAASWIRRRETVPDDPVARAARRTLAALLDERTAADAAELARLGEETLAVAPGAQEWQAVSRAILRARAAVQRGEPRESVERLLGQAVSPLVALVRNQSVPLNGDTRGSRLRRSWAEESRRR